MDIQLEVGVKAFLRNKDNKYLLLRRSNKYGELAGTWDIVGGRINPGTSLFENLKREIKEETSLELREDPKLIFAQDILKFHEKHIVRLTYIADIDGEVRLDEEHTDFKWLSLAEMLKEADLDEFVREILEKGLVT